jgi:hypothetical protein
MMGDFNAFKSEVLRKTTKLGKTTLAGFLTQAISDTQRFLEAQAQEFATWTNDLEAGSITQEQFEFLVQAQLAVFQMHALTEAGIAAAQIQQFRDALVQIISDAAIKYFVHI